MVCMEEIIVRKNPVLHDETNGKYRNAEYKDMVWKNIASTSGIKGYGLIMYGFNGNASSAKITIGSSVFVFGKDLVLGGVEECKKKWSSVRDQLRRTLQKRKTTSGQAALRYRKYKYEDVLEFLLPHIAERETLSNVPNLKTHEQEDETSDILPTDTQEENINIEYIGEKSDPVELNPEPTTSENTSKFFVKNVCERKFNRYQRKTDVERNGNLVSPESQLMAYMLSEKKEENKKIKTTEQDIKGNEVDAFLQGISFTLKKLDPIKLNEAKSIIFSTVQELEKE